MANPEGLVERILHRRRETGAAAGRGRRVVRGLRASWLPFEDA